MTTISSSLLVKLIDGVSAPAKKAAASLAGIGRAASGVNGTRVGGIGERLGRAAEANAVRMDELRGKMVDAVGVGYVLAGAISAPIKAAMAFESAMADVKKVVDFETPQAFKEMQRNVIDMSRRIPMAASDLTTILANAGQAGIASSELLKFTEVAAKVGVAFDISAETAGEALAKMKTGLGISVDEVSLLSDAMNHLSNQQASSAADILDVVRRTGATAKQFGFNATQVSAFASAMLSAGAESDVAATSFLNMGRALTAGGEATTRQRGGLARLGLDSVKVAKRMQKDAVGTTLDVMERLARLPAFEQNATSLAIFGAEARALGPLLTNLDLLRESIRYVDDAQKYAGSSAKEYEARAATTANSLQLFRNRLNALGIQIGVALMPGLNRMLDIFGPIVDRIADFAERFPGLTSGIVAMTGSIAALRVAMIGAAFASRFMLGGALSGAVAAVAGGGKLKRLGALMLAPFVAFGTKIKGILQIIRLRFGLARAAGLGFGRAFTMGAAATMTRALMSLLSPIGLVKKALRGLLLGSGIGVVLLGLGLLAEWVSNNWEGMKVGFEAFSGAFLRELGPIRAQIQPIIDIFSEWFGVAEKLTGTIDNGTWARAGVVAGSKTGAGIRSLIETINDAVTALDRFGQKVVSIRDTIAHYLWGIDYAAPGREAIQSLWDGMVSKFDELVGWVASIPGKIRDAIGSIDLSGIVQWPSMPSWLGGGGSAAAPAAPARSAYNGDGVPVGGGDGKGPPARARGGYVKQGHMYRVNDDRTRDPVELFAPGRSGTVYPSSQRRSAAGAGGAAGANVTISNSFTISGAQDPQSVAREVSRIIAREAQKAKRGLFADIGIGRVL